MHKNSSPAIRIVIPMKIATTPHFGSFVISAALSKPLLNCLSTFVIKDFAVVVEASVVAFVTSSAVVDLDNFEQ